MAPPLRVVDTSAWIEWFTGSALGKKLRKQFPDKSRCIVPTIVQLELSKWLVPEIGEEQADQVIAYTQKCVVIPLNTTIALLAADLHREHKLATAVRSSTRPPTTRARNCSPAMRISTACRTWHCRPRSLETGKIRLMHLRFTCQSL